MATTVLNGCSQKGANTQNTTAQENTKAGESTQNENQILGQVTEITDSNITISVGTMKEMEGMTKSGKLRDNAVKTDQKDGNLEVSDSSDDASNTSEKKDVSSVIDLTGETKTINLVEGTEFKKSQFGRMGKPNGEAPSGDVPEGKERPDGEAPSGDAPEGKERPDGEAPSGDVPEGKERPDGEAPSGDAPDGNLRGGVPQGQEEDIEVSEIQVGDIVSITLDEDGNAKSIVVQGFGMNGGPEGMSNGADIEYTAVNEYLSGATTGSQWSDYEVKKA